MTTRTAMRFGAWVQQKAPPVKRDAVQSHDPSKSSLIQSVFRFRWRKNWRKWRKSAPSTASNPLSPSTSSVDGLHRGEEQHVADGVGVGQKHDQAIHAEAQAASRGQDGPFGSIRGRNLLWHKGFRVSMQVLPLCWTRCFFRLGPRDIEGWGRRSEVLKSLEMTAFYHEFGALLEHFGAPLQRLFQCSSKLVNSRFFRSLVASA